VTYKHPKFQLAYHSQQSLTSIARLLIGQLIYFEVIVVYVVLE
jgi:hypothetical protein